MTAALQPDPGGAALSCHGVTVRYGPRHILRGVDFTVAAGETVALVGPNGAGKSTLLGVLAGDIVGEEGQTRIGDRPLATVPTRDLARTRAVMLQEHRMSFAFPVIDVVRMGRAPWTRTEDAADDEDIVATALRTAEIAHLARQSYATLSGGERARTSFARILAQQTPVLLLDEPTAALDIAHQEQLLRHCRELAADGAAVVLVLHDLNLAAAYADRVVVLAGGEVAADGSPATVLTTELLSRVYRCPIEVLPHPSSDGVLILPRRGPDRTAFANLSENPHVQTS